MWTHRNNTFFPLFLTDSAHAKRQLYLGHHTNSPVLSPSKKLPQAVFLSAFWKSRMLLARATAPQSPALIPALRKTTLYLLLLSHALHASFALKSRSPIVQLLQHARLEQETVHFGPASMPIFQDDDDTLVPEKGPPSEQPTNPRSRSTTPPESVSMRRKSSEESIRTELCEGPVLESLEDLSSYSPEGLNSCFASPLHRTSDRLQYIERLKRGDSPSWLPNQNLESLLDNNEAAGSTQHTNRSTTSYLLASPKFSDSRPTAGDEGAQTQLGLQIERPRSALHSGDFTERTHQSTNSAGTSQSKNSKLSAGESPWLASSPPRNFSPLQLDSRFPPIDHFHKAGPRRSRAPSLSSSYSNSFALKPPTSPLVQSESNDDISYVNPIDISPDYQRISRRHTFQYSNSISSSSSFTRPLPSLRRDSTHPYQAHQPRRSLTSNPTSFNSPSQTPDFQRTRRPSYTSENSPLHASMVGSYEESILRGRMSTTPSKPLDFVAQIGVLGLGKCKSNLRCPAHVTLPFPAVFYSYETTSHGRVGKSEDGPSPYVGQIDLENGLPNTNESKSHKRKRTNNSRTIGRSAESATIQIPNSSHLNESGTGKLKRRSLSPRAPPGGSYRIPEKGQLQIIIKNPNKTAVKLFLIPYDLAGMEPGTKTFIRQRSYSAGDSLLPASSSTATNSMDRQTLRYLAHLHICSPSRGRFYLYKSIRVVFANRVPDGKEKLRNEVSLPEPRYTVYKPGRDLNIAHSITSLAGAGIAADKAFRRRSSGFALGIPGRPYDTMEGITQALQRGFSSSAAYSQDRDNSYVLPVEPIPFSLDTNTTVPGGGGHQQLSDIQSPTSSKSSRPATSQGGHPMSWASSPVDIDDYGKLSKGDAGYGGNLFSSSPDGTQQIAEGLLAKKLRDLGVRRQSPQDTEDNT
ncbi:hypothetical protein GLAREA_01727 [Glarea lozoyensis ATCC 20868]|uniref:Atos-like conserved domain-containing protein n=1 Tax=Glarea lozoyensis (strain ATCC 20868 / MF5171) TaxID=1116229 RepID=S3CJ63_GLAL2|nr:uncharacterized protein GLAREA_01727 [Glarea lozoyensis ATCC 20868]EPE25815.1 hypothetical protein GLAREA_01727 [Glarea lozoyensis ATCC 20868]